MSFIKRLLGICQTEIPQNVHCWNYDGKELTVDLSMAPEVSQAGSAMRIEGKTLPNRVLVVHGDDNEWYVFKNKCTHGGRRLDPLKGESKLQCCSIGKSEFDYQGNILGGSAKKNIVGYPVELNDKTLTVKL